MHILEGDDDVVEPRASFGRNGSSLSCAVPFSPLLLLNTLSRKSFSYNRLPQEPLKLTVLKLDGSSFATVAELKQAVEASFSYLPKTGLGKVSWSHVWGHFCLCYDGQKLLTDGDYIGSYGIKEGDQLQFIRHLSIKYNMIKERPEKQVPDIEESGISDACEEGEHKIWDDDNYDDQENLTYEQDDDEGSDIITHCEYKLAHLLRGWFSYRRLTGSHMRFEQKSYSNSSRFSN
ncbi:hypothetical protein RJ639_028807, partial [Escallonia herrerae]